MILDAIAVGILSVSSATLPDAWDDYWYTPWGPWLLTNSVTPDTAIQTTAVNACINKRAGTMASMPFHVYEWGGPAWPGSKRHARYRVPDHPLEQIMNRQPNDWQTAAEFIEMMEGHVCTRGNGYAVIVPGRSGAVDQLIPRHPDRMEVVRLENGRLGYIYTLPDGLKRRYVQDEIFHLRGQTLDGLTGLSPIALHRRAVEVAQAAEDHAAKYFKAGKPSGALKMPAGQTLEDEEAQRRMRKSWRDAHSGDDLYSVAILEDGLEWQQIGFSQKDAQYLESRQFQTIEICRMFDVPPIMIFSEDQQDNTYSNVESKDLWYIKHCAQRWVRRWEQTIWRDLIVEHDRYYARFIMEGLLRADTKTRGEWYERMVGMAAFCPNDVLELEDRNPHPDGEKYYVSVQLVPIEQAGQPQGAEMATTAETDMIAAETGETPVLAEAEPSNENAISSVWADDIASRLAAKELRELSERVDKAGEDRDRFNAWVADHWGGKMRAYVLRTIEPYLLATGRGTLDEIADQMVGSAVAVLTAGDPAEVFATWKSERAGELALILNDGGSHESRNE